MKPRNVDVLIGLLGEYRWLHLLKGRVYDTLIDYLIRIAPEWLDDKADFQFPTIKKISADLNEKRIHKWLPMIADDLMELNQEEPELFRTKESDLLYAFHASDKSEDAWLSYHIWTDRHFHIGERFHWSFAKVRLPHNFFWISDIDHSYGNGTIITTIFLKSGFPNIYRELLFHRALFERKISFLGLRKTTDYQLDDILREIYK
ncbi:hypothetical protein [Parapedobacter sp. DT-150]|uniref:hypothetical protein n=1 Tax=Parapedobacter sp. DT-150 TaxID=3396162 RepID=UPI003F1BAD77